MSGHGRGNVGEPVVGLNDDGAELGTAEGSKLGVVLG